ncbi:hypothetical protein RRG08_050185 [Elysia crispata]|uniref:G-protein coupled receptors family 1 profile domain-containing protein n=1 Tax=Elysia crispata TaxID=231223 RepID=A0AAE0Z7N7_9GAST|nr:hypothetical protein RRG08_050185 [Elysia crispata]
MDNSTAGFVAKGLISNETFAYLMVLFRLVLNPAVGILGLCANVINVVVFYKMGLTDGVTQNFFILSISDGCLASATIIASVSYILYTQVYVGVGGPEYTAQVVYCASILIGAFPHSVSMATTVVIAVIRCLCVAIPLHVKFLMTARRQLAVILAFSSCSAGLLIYAFSPSRAVLVNNPLTNTPFILIVDLKWFEYTVYSNATSYIGFIIVIICVIVLTVSLNRSSSFRGKSASRVSTSVSTGEQTKDGRKEARVIKTVVFVSIVFIVCYLPAMTVTMIGTLVKEFSTVGIYRNANLLNLMIMDLFTAINASVNIFIYYFFNTRFRTTFNTVFGKLPK